MSVFIPSEGKDVNRADRIGDGGVFSAGCRFWSISGVDHNYVMKNPRSNQVNFTSKGCYMGWNYLLMLTSKTKLALGA